MSVHTMTAARGRTDFPVAIIGAGFAGIGMGIQREQAGIESFTIFERAGEIGGTRRDNTYTEAQIPYALQAIRSLLEENVRHVDVKRGVQDRYDDRLQRRMKCRSWSSGCHDGYLSSDGGTHALCPGFASEYIVRARRFGPSDHEIARA